MIPEAILSPREQSGDAVPGIRAGNDAVPYWARQSKEPRLSRVRTGKIGRWRGIEQADAVIHLRRLSNPEDLRYYSGGYV